MRVVVTGATGNVGTSVLEALSRDEAVEEIVAIARRAPEAVWPKTRFVAADVSTDDLREPMRGADVVVHLAWLIQPSRDRATTRRVNVQGSGRVFAAAAQEGVPAIIYASSVGAYSPGPKDQPVAETWPTEGISSSFYASDKAAVERLLDSFEVSHPEIRVVRLRPGLIFKAEAATGIRRLFAGPLLPNRLVRAELLPILPLPSGLRFQAVDSRDVAAAYRLAVRSQASGPFNIAAEPILDAAVLGRALSARTIELPPGALRAVVSASWRLRLQPTSPGWLDMALAVPVMSTLRAREELGWRPQRTSVQALEDLIGGIHDGSDLDTPPLARSSSGRLRWRELLSGIGGRSR